MSKYIIKNCACYNKDYSCQSKDNSTGKYCQDCTNCVMKQIVELCEEESSLIQHGQKIKVKGLNKLADKIFELLDIQEIE